MIRRALLGLAGLVVVLLLVAAWFGVPFAQRVTKVVPTAETAFHWPYYLYVPSSLREPVHLLVLPNNTGRPDDDPAVHARDALKRAFRLRGLADQLGVPLLVPCFPRPAADWRIYTHALDRDTLLTEIPELARIDRQLDAMIDDALGKLRGRGVTIDDQILITGFSANGMFANRFTVLHPERVLAAAVGSPGGWPIAPVSEWQGKLLRYPIGVADVPFHGDAFRRVRWFFFMGDQDQNDSLDYGDGWDEEDQVRVDELFGADPPARWPLAERIYGEAHAAASFRLYPGVGHERTKEMDRDVAAFFAEAMGR